MSEKENEAREVVDHWSHVHTLTLVETHSRTDKCFGCRRYFSGGEKAYRCSQYQKCRRNVYWGQFLLHQECAGLPRKIKHTMHPQHILTQVVGIYCRFKTCAICNSFSDGIVYKCTSAECMFVIHIKCAQGSDVIDAADDDDDEQSGSIIDHPSHPSHKLKLVRRYCSFMCDACGTTHGERSSYMCCETNCQYWIHERCASSPQTIEREDHHHSLSLSFHVPPLYMKYDYKCDVCSKYLLFKYWIYHCQLCSYVVHLECAFNKLPQAREKNDEEKRIMVFPISDVGEDQIGAFVKRQGGTITIPPIPHHDVDYEFHNHKLILVSSSSSSQEEVEENSDDDDDGQDHYGCQKSELICDGCNTPIFRKQISSSSSSSSKDYCYYMSCNSGCNYNLHMACFHLPPRLPSIPLHHQSGHHLILKFSNRVQYQDYCHVCELRCSNGLIYKCAKCDFKADIKCASMPDTIYHQAHPQHPLSLLLEGGYNNFCRADCKSYTRDYYVCDSCEFIVHVGCAMLPASIISRRWDKHHPLPLTYDANLNRPGEFYCDECETEMNPKSWMYHCRHCDISFHPECFKTTSGYYRNIKFGKEYSMNASTHPHPLAFQLLITKRHCNVCDEDRYECLGFHCASCNFFICHYNCGEEMLKHGDIKAVD